MAKTLILGIIGLLSFGNNLFSQTEYMPIGAQLNGTTWGLSYRGIFTTTSEKDTLCGGTPCRKITLIEKDNNAPKTISYNYFSRQIKDSIFFWNNTSQRFDLKFRTNMSVGDSIRYRYSSFPIGDTTTTLYADSIMYINAMRITKCHLYCPDYMPGGIPFRVEFSIYDRYAVRHFIIHPHFFVILVVLMVHVIRLHVIEIIKFSLLPQIIMVQTVAWRHLQMT